MPVMNMPPANSHHTIYIYICFLYILYIKLLESPIPTAPTAPPAPSQKAHFALCIATKRGTIDPLVSKRPEKNSE